MTRTSALTLRVSALAVVALALAACAPSAPAETEAPATPSASAPATSAEPPATEPAPSESTPDADAQVFVSQDGAVRFTLPEGWSVDDRSAMGPASEMYNTGPGWLNELVLLDEVGAQMIWYHEFYGDDSVVCADREWPLEVPIDPYGPAFDGEETGQVLIVGESGPATSFEGDAPAGAGGVRMALEVEFANDDCAGFDESIWLGNRITQVDVVADAPDAEYPNTLIEFPDEQAASAWLRGEEAAVLIEVLSSIEFTGAPMLDAAP